jgi:hypothetical protein
MKNQKNHQIQLRFPIFSGRNREALGSQRHAAGKNPTTQPDRRLPEKEKRGLGDEIWPDIDQFYNP